MHSEEEFADMGRHGIDGDGESIKSKPLQKEPRTYYVDIRLQYGRPYLYYSKNGNSRNQ